MTSIAPSILERDPPLLLSWRFLPFFFPVKGCLRVFPAPMWGQRSGMSICTDCNLWKWAIQINWIETELKLNCLNRHTLTVVPKQSSLSISRYLWLWFKTSSTERDGSFQCISVFWWRPRGSALVCSFCLFIFKPAVGRVTHTETLTVINASFFYPSSTTTATTKTLALTRTFGTPGFQRPPFRCKFDSVSHCNYTQRSSLSVRLGTPRHKERTSFHWSCFCIVDLYSSVTVFCIFYCKS